MQENTRKVLEALSEAPTEAQRQFTREKVDAVEHRMAKLLAVANAGNNFNVELFNVARIMASDSLLHAYQARQDASEQRKLESWFAACRWVSEQIDNSVPMTVADICQLNRIVMGLPPESVEGFRTTAGHAGGDACVCPEDVPEMMRIFEQQVIALMPQEHGLINAARVFQWLISIHPFTDGNGRTARLCADWALGERGIVAISYPDASESLVGVFTERKNSNPTAAVATVCDGVIYSCECLLKSV